MIEKQLWNGTVENTPTPEIVVETILSLGNNVPAVDVCNSLVSKGYSRKRAQLGIQRAHDKRSFVFNHDWSLFVDVLKKKI